MKSAISAPTLVRLGLAVMLDAVGVSGLAWLGWQVMFGRRQAFEAHALVVGLVGVLACWFAPGRGPRLPVPLVAYVAIAALSAAVHQWPAASMPSGYLSILSPAAHLVVMVIFVKGGAHLLRTPARLSVLVVAAGLAGLTLAVRTLFDQALNGFVFQPALQVLLPSVAYWGGIHDLAFAAGLAVPLVMAPGLTKRTWPTAGAGLLLASVPMLAAVATGSRSAVVNLVTVAVMMVVVTVFGSRVIRRPLALAGIAVLSVAAGSAILVWAGALDLERLLTVSGRSRIWSATWVLIRENPWLGVGPGNYPSALTARGMQDHIVGPGSAHNLFLHIAAEIGVCGAMLWLAYLLTMMRTCWRAWMGGPVGLVAGGFLSVLMLFALQWVTESFIEGSFFVARHRVLAWICFAAVAAIARLTSNEPASSAGRV